MKITVFKNLTKFNTKFFLIEDKEEKDLFRYFLSLSVPIYIQFFVFEIFDILNDVEINKDYKNNIYNWNMNPIKSIKLININNESNYDFQWKSEYFTTEKLNDFDYINLYQNSNGKICGKDSFGTDLYFPNDVDCPINKIYFSSSEQDLPDYQKIKLNDNKYIYYTNTFIEGKILVELRISQNSDITLNPESSSNVLTNISFCQEIDSDSGNEILYLYSINYLGINTSSISEKGISKINNLNKNIKKYNALAKVKIAFLCVESVYVIFLVITFIIFYDVWGRGELLLILLFGIIFILVYAIIIIVSLHLNKKYISNFIYQIQYDL